MIIDADNVSEPAALCADVCIVGAGAAGIAMALQFIGTKIEVLLLESGGLRAGSGDAGPLRGQVVDERLHSPPDRYRRAPLRRHHTIWGGRCMPFDPIDFEPRRLRCRTAAGRSAMRILRRSTPKPTGCARPANSLHGRRSLARSAQPMIAGFQSEIFHSDTLERFSCPTDFGARYGHKLRAAGNITVVLHANVTASACARAGSRRVAGGADFGRQLTAVHGRTFRARCRWTRGGAPAAREPRCAV